MIFQKPSLLEQFSETQDSAASAPARGTTSFRARDPTVPILSDTIGSKLSPSETTKRLQLIADCARKVLAPDQVAIVVLVPYVVYWVATNGEERLGHGANDVTSIAEALEIKLGGPNSELVAEHVVRASTRAQLGIQNRNTIELRASEKLYKVDLDCYFDDPDLHAIIALMTPLNDAQKTGYEGAQLSSMRYHLGILITRMGHNNSPRRSNQGFYRSTQRSYPAAHPGDSSTISLTGGNLPNTHLDNVDQKVGQNENGSAGSDRENGFWSEADLAAGFIADFIPPISNREVEHFYAMLPDSNANSFVESHVALDRPIHEEEMLVGDPDNFDPHLRMRLLQQSSLSPVVPRPPREPAVVQAELEQEARMFARGGIGPRQGTQNKKNDVRCLQCGVDSSPEWRKGPMGPKTLCNRCGLRYAKKLRMSN